MMGFLLIEEMIPDLGTRIIILAVLLFLLTFLSVLLMIKIRDTDDEMKRQI